MKLTTEERGNVSIVHLDGSLTGGDESAWVQPVTRLLDKTAARVVLDMANVSYVSSAGLGDLVRLTALANTQGSRLVVACLTPFVTDVLKTTRLDRFFEVYPNVDAAVGEVR